MAQVIRTPYQVMKATVFALIIRNVREKFIQSSNTRRSLGFLWLFIEPALQVAMWVGIYASFGSLGTAGMPTTVFIFLGAMPWVFFRRCLSFSVTGVKKGAGLYVYRQVKPIDVMLSLVIAEGSTLLIVYAIGLLGFWWFGVQYYLYQPLYFFVNLVSFAAFTFGLCLIFLVAGFFFPFLKNFVFIVQRGLYFLSGVFFAATAIPPPYRDYLILNPLFQVIEISREAFTKVGPMYPYSNAIYLLKCSIVAGALGIAVYFISRRRIMMDINSR
jgi:capsular polysaccharide transport system permease protein